jgi:phosphoenolpyruvate-protein kinase (PTS system EI component)
MIATLGEFQAALDFIAACRKSLAEAGIPFDAATPLGIMIETPAAAVMADELAKHADFFSIGTNDLTQYTLAADRTNEHVAAIFDPFDPAVLRLMRLAVLAAKKWGIPIAVCGEIAGHPNATELLIGLGVDELSVTPNSILVLKKRILRANATNAGDLAARALGCDDGAKVRALLASHRSRPRPGAE